VEGKMDRQSRVTELKNFSRAPDHKIVSFQTRSQRDSYSLPYIMSTDVKQPIDTEVEILAVEEMDPVLKERQEWIKYMRLKFCIRPEFEITKTMIHEDGTLNQE
jgi:hypothetical protein